METELTALEVKAGQVFDTLHKHGIYGNIRGKWKEEEKQLLVEAITSQALGEWQQDALVIRYLSGIHLIVKTHVLDGVAELSSVRATCTSTSTVRVDYKDLSAELQMTVKR